MKTIRGSLFSLLLFIRSKIQRALSHVRGSLKIVNLILRPSSHDSSAGPSRKRLLAVWDFGAQPYSVGDIILLHELSLSLCHELDLSSIEFCLLADPDDPCRASFKKLKVNSVNHIEYISALIPVFLIGDRVSGLHFFNSPSDLEKFILSNSDQYHVWPDFYRYAAKKDLNSISFFQIAQFHRDHGFIPALSFRRALVDWGNSFISHVAKDKTPVVVHIRNAGDYNPSRNSGIDTWIEFFEWCSDRFPVLFIIICSKEEVDDRLRTLPNIVIAKDHDTTLDQDLALIYCAPAFMGAPSGPSTVAYFGDKPYSILNSHLGELTPCLEKHSWGYSWNYAKKNQRLVTSENETKQLLIDEFKILYDAMSTSSTENKEKPYKPQENKLRFRTSPSARHYS